MEAIKEDCDVNVENVSCNKTPTVRNAVGCHVVNACADGLGIATKIEWTRVCTVYENQLPGTLVKVLSSDTSSD